MHSRAFKNITKHFPSRYSQSPEALLAELKESGLRGRGGAGFPIAFKLDSCRNTAGKQKFIIVCNADEGDPGAYSDRYLMEQQPHAVLLGMMIVGISPVPIRVFYTSVQNIPNRRRSCSRR